jgi:hypothetical protein
VGERLTRDTFEPTEGRLVSGLVLEFTSGLVLALTLGGGICCAAISASVIELGGIAAIIVGGVGGGCKGGRAKLSSGWRLPLRIVEGEVGDWGSLETPFWVL